MVLSIAPIYGETPYRFLAFGNSLTQHPATNYWWNLCGMAASKPKYDWVHRVESRLKKQYGAVHTDVIHTALSDDVVTQEARDRVDAQIGFMSQNPYALIVIEEGDNIEFAHQMKGYDDKLNWLIGVMKKYNPQAQIVVVGNFHLDSEVRKQCEALQKQIAKNNEVKYADLSALKENKHFQSTVGATVYDAQGRAHTVDSWTVARHPNDLGMEYIASKVLEQIGLTLPVGNDFDVLSQKQTEKQKTVTLDPHKNGWITKNKKKYYYYYYYHGLRAQGLAKIHKRYYYFDENGILKKNQVIKGKVTYYLNQQGILQLKKVDKDYYNSQNQPVRYESGLRYETYLLSQAKVKKWEKDDLNKAYKGLLKAKSMQPINKSITQTNVAKQALCFLEQEKGDKLTKASAFVYLALALGYKEITLSSDQKDLKKANYTVQIKGTTYLFGKKNKKKAYKKIKITLPKLTAIKVKFSKKKGKLIKYDQDSGYLYYENGQYATGLVAYKNKFYDFDRTGALNQEQTYKINQAATTQNRINDLEKIIGKPLRKNYSASCFGDGEDGLWVYKNFILSTFKGYDGVEIYIAVKDR